MASETLSTGENRSTQDYALSLRAVKEDDVEEVFEWARSQDPHYLEQAGPEIGSIYGSLENLLTMVNNGRIVFQDIVVDNARVGNIFLAQKTLHSKRAELGFIIDQDQQGKGYAKVAVAAMADLAFDTMGMESLIARTTRHNKASANTLYATGFSMVFPLRSGDDTILIFKRLRSQPVRGYKIGYLSPTLSRT